MAILERAAALDAQKEALLAEATQVSCHICYPCSQFFATRAFISHMRAFLLLSLLALSPCTLIFPASCSAARH